MPPSMSSWQNPTPVAILTVVPSNLLSLLSDASEADSVDEFAEALLRAWACVVRADYHSLIRFSQPSETVTYWHPGEGRLGPDHWLPRLFAGLLAAEKPLETHPSTEAFLKHGPGAYLRSAIEKDKVWRRRRHYRLVDSKHGIEDTLTLFLSPAHGALVTLHAGSKGSHFESTVSAPAQEFGSIADALVAARGGFNDRTPAPKPRLTKREAEILRWVAEGKRNAEIAIILALSAHTVRNHLENIFAKLQVDTRTAAAAALHAMAIPRQATTTDNPAATGRELPSGGKNSRRYPRAGAAKAISVATKDLKSAS